jgi:lipopolysaccharide/colanic/teichoic acid biosynthesis glycosyltransferase
LPCGNCDNCLHPPQTWDATEAARKALSCVYRTGQRYGAGHLIDVLRGDMSVVGPRPEVPRYVAMWGDDARAEILSVRPGISDPAAIAFRNEQDVLAAADDPERHYVEVILPQKVAMYLDYVRTRSFVGDLRVIFGTLAEIARG